MKLVFVLNKINISRYRPVLSFFELSTEAIAPSLTIHYGKHFNVPDCDLETKSPGLESKIQVQMSEGKVWLTYSCL